MPAPRFSVAVVVERVPLANRWASEQWRVAAVEPDDAPAAPPHKQFEDATRTRWRCAGHAVELHRSEAEGYFLNITSPEPKIFVMWRGPEADGSRRRRIQAASASRHRQLQRGRPPARRRRTGRRGAPCRRRSWRGCSPSWRNTIDPSPSASRAATDSTSATAPTAPRKKRTDDAQARSERRAAGTPVALALVAPQTRRRAPTAPQRCNRCRPTRPERAPGRRRGDGGTGRGRGAAARSRTAADRLAHTRVRLHGFFQPQGKVDEALKRAALKQLLRDPRFNVMDGLDIYVGDYTKSDPIPDEVLKRLVQARAIFNPPKTMVNAEGHVVDVPPDADALARGHAGSARGHRARTDRSGATVAPMRRGR